jgi:hypothetical protein
MVENSVGLGQASVSGAVGPEGSVELLVGKGGGVAVTLPKPPVPVVSATLDERVNRPVRSPPLFVNTGPVEFWTGSDKVEFRDTGGNVIEPGGAVVEFDGTNGVSTMIVTFVVGEGMTSVMFPVGGGGKIVERLPVEKDGTVE